MIQINYQDKRPIYEQVVERFRQLIVMGVLKEDEKIPSVRNLAIDLSINPNTIQKAYQELERQGFVYTVKGRGNFVSARDQWMAEESVDLLKQLKGCAKELALLGVSKGEIVSAVESAVENATEHAAEDGPHDHKKDNNKDNNKKEAESGSTGEGVTKGKGSEHL